MDGDLTPAAFAQHLRQRLAPERWPLPLSALPADAVLVGGAVRDAALGRLEDAPDLDLVVADGAIALAEQLARHHRGSCVVLDAERDIARLVLRGWTIDLARREGPDLTSDLARRDYSVNAIALPLAPGSTVVDPHGGLEHLRHRTLVAIAETNLLDDPLRLLRGVRLAAELHFSIAEPTRTWIQRHAARLAMVAGERVLAELEKLATTPSGHTGLQQAWELGLLNPWGAKPAEGLFLPPLCEASAATLGLAPQEQASALPIARLAWLLDGRAVEQLKGSRRLQQRCGVLRHWWQALAGRPLDQLEEPARLALHEHLASDFPALVLGLNPEDARQALERWRDPADPLFHPRAPLDGRQLQQALALQPGPALGQLLAHLKRERAFGRLAGPNENAAALDCARRWLLRQPAA